MGGPKSSKSPECVVFVAPSCQVAQVFAGLHLPLRASGLELGMSWDEGLVFRALAGLGDPECFRV